MLDLVNNIQQTVLGLLPAGKKGSNGDWVSFNAVCCRHNGESTDKRGRGGVRTNTDGSINYHCFNCGFKAGYYPGRQLGFRFRKLLRWLGADDNTIQFLVMESMRVRELMPAVEHTQEPRADINFKARSLPPECASFHEWATLTRLQDADAPLDKQFHHAVDYIYDRAINMQRYDFYTSTDTSYNMHRRVIVPFTWKNEIIGYTARAVEDGIKPKYHNSHEPGYVFNVDQQPTDAKFVIVTEGPFDAMSVDGVAILGNAVSDIQAEILENLDRQIIVVPDWDEAGEQLIHTAIEYGWSVSFPVWRDRHKDVNSAVIEHGKLFVIKSILDAVESNPLKIKLRMKM